MHRYERLPPEAQALVDEGWLDVDVARGFKKRKGDIVKTKKWLVKQKKPKQPENYDAMVRKKAELRRRKSQSQRDAAKTAEDELLKDSLEFLKKKFAEEGDNDDDDDDSDEEA